MSKRVHKKKTTIYSSVRHAMRPRGLEYLLNFARFIARNPEVLVPYGTTPNEAFHKELVSFFRNIMTPGRETVQGLAKAITSIKLVAGMMKKTAVSKRYSQSLLLREYCDDFEANPLCFRPLLNVGPEIWKQVDVSGRDARAKGVARRHGVHKRPAARQAAPVPRGRLLAPVLRRITGKRPAPL